MTIMDIFKEFLKIIFQLLDFFKLLIYQQYLAVLTVALSNMSQNLIVNNKFIKTPEIPVMDTPTKL